MCNVAKVRKVKHLKCHNIATFGCNEATMATTTMFRFSKGNMGGERTHKCSIQRGSKIEDQALKVGTRP